MISFIFATLLNLSTAFTRQQYILTPKSISFDVKAVEFIANKYDLDTLSVFGDNVIYLSHHDKVISNRAVLSEFFDIEEDVVISLNQIVYESWNSTSEYEVPWHLSRVGQKELPLEDRFSYLEPGSCHTDNNTLINTYIVDTGIDITHPLFQGRARWGANLVDNQDTDCNNHGTHVAGLVGAHGYGVCADANLIAVKVLDCEGSGSLSGVIKGIEWVFKQHKTETEKMKMMKDKRRLKSVINMSLGGGHSPALNRAVEVCVQNEEDFYIVVAAGNENADACKSSPAGVKTILTVMASDSSDNRAWFSNWGGCSNIYAPGVDVVSTTPDNSFAKYSGTSMASPVMAGVLNHFLDMYPEQNMAEIVKTVLSHGSKKMINGDKPKTPNVLVYLERDNQ